MCTQVVKTAVRLINDMYPAAHTRTSNTDASSGGGGGGSRGSTTTRSPSAALPEVVLSLPQLQRLATSALRLQARSGDAEHAADLTLASLLHALHERRNALALHEIGEALQLIVQQRAPAVGRAGAAAEGVVLSDLAAAVLAKAGVAVGGGDADVAADPELLSSAPLLVSVLAGLDAMGWQP